MRPHRLDSLCLLAGLRVLVLTLLLVLSRAHAQTAPITLAWEYTGTGHDGFRLERKTGQAGPYAVLPGAMAPTARQTTDSTAPVGQIVCYRLAATLMTLTSPYSNEVCLATLVAPVNLRIQ